MIEVSKLTGLKVITTDAFTIGNVDWAESNTESWRITHLHVKVTNEITNELGFRKPFMLFFDQVRISLENPWANILAKQSIHGKMKN